MNKLVVGTVATLTFLGLMAINAYGAVKIGGSPVYNGSVVKLRIVNNQFVPVTPVTQTPTAPPIPPSNVITVRPPITQPTQAGNVVVIKPTQPAQPSPVTPVPTTPTAPSTSLTADEQIILDMVNQERISAGLNPVHVDMRLVTVGRKKAQDMVDDHYFDHTSPIYGSPWVMMTAEGIKYKYAGENIAGHRTAVGAMTNWMASIGHRANILNPSFTHIGIGVAYQGSPYNIYVQEFAQE